MEEVRARKKLHWREEVRYGKEIRDNYKRSAKKKKRDVDKSALYIEGIYSINGKGITGVLKLSREKK